MCNADGADWHDLRAYDAAHLAAALTWRDEREDPEDESVFRVAGRLGSPVRRRGHAVADAALGEDVDGLGGVVAELAAQAPDKGAHQLRVDVFAAPDEARQVVVGTHASGVARERAQQVVLGGGEVQL